MFIINFSKLIKIWRNSKNRIVSVNKLEHEKDDDVKIIVEGKFKGKEEDVSKPPKWFKEFETKINKKITRLNENFENKTPKWFKHWENKINKKIAKLNENLENKTPKWFKDWEKNSENKVPKWFKDWEKNSENKVPKWFKDWEKNSENKVPKWFKNWEKNSENKVPKWFKNWNQKTFIPFKEKVEKDITAMKNTPTMKRELGLS